MAHLRYITILALVGCSGVSWLTPDGRPVRQCSLPVTYSDQRLDNAAAWWNLQLHRELFARGVEPRLIYAVDPSLSTPARVDVHANGECLGDAVMYVRGEAQPATLRHELGHVLGLEDCGVEGHLMRNYSVEDFAPGFDGYGTAKVAAPSSGELADEERAWLVKIYGGGK